METTITTYLESTNFSDKSLSDWLHASVADGGGSVSKWSRPLSLGHDLLAKHLVATDVASAERSEVRLSEYSLKYTFHHIASMDDEVARGGLLDGVCGNWGFLRRVFEAGQGAKMLKAIGGLAQGGGVSAYAMDSYRWLGQCFNELEAKPGEMEKVTIKSSPIMTAKFLEAKARVRERQRRERQQAGGGQTPSLTWFASQVLGGKPQDQ